jgi:hypothetical protein
MRSDGSSNFVNSPRRVTTVCLFLLVDSCEFEQVLLRGTYSPVTQNCYVSSQHLKALTFLILIENLQVLLRKFLRALLAATLQYFQILNLLNSVHSLRHQSLNNFTQVTKPKTLLGLHTPCTAPMLNLHFPENENNFNPPELSEIKL